MTTDPRPLAVRMRPTSLNDLKGQDHLLAPGSALQRLVGADAPTSVFLWGPAGTGKTTIARIVAGSTSRRFVELSAVNATIKDVREAIAGAVKAMEADGTGTVLFIDEIHRFSKTQQDALLPAVENRTVTLIAATTENPSFSVVNPLLSRSVLLTLRPLDDQAINTVIGAALDSPDGLDGRFTLEVPAWDALRRLAGGDARRTLTYLEEAARAAEARGSATIDADVLVQAVDKAVAVYDRDGDQHYDVISAFIKSMRGSDPDAALHWLARMIDGGEDPRFIARRLMIHASEDVGTADPTALLVATAAAQVVQLVGMPEASLALAQAAVTIATAPKSAAVYKGINAALADMAAGATGAVPAHLRDAHYPGAQALSHGKGYLYPHDHPHAVVAQQYLPDQLAGRRYYEPTDRGTEANIAGRLSAIRHLTGEE